MLSDVVVRLYGNPSSARLAWLAIKAHFVRLSVNNRTFLLKDMQDLEPREGESMEAFLNRCALLRRKFAEYDLVCDDHLLITQVMSKLSIQWRTRAGLDGSLDAMSWEQVAIALQTEDNDRRASNTKSPEALLPLGWTRRSGGEPRSGASAQVPPARPRASPHAHVAEGNAAPAMGGSGVPKGKGPKGPNPQGETKISVPVVCWYCQEIGHLWSECSTKPKGWKPSPGDKDKAEATRNEMRRRKKQSLDDKAAHAARVAGQSSQSEASAEARCSGEL